MERGPADDEVARINDMLAREYGINTTDSRPIFRVVWANNEMEKRLMRYTDSGVELLTPEIREVPKYRQWAADRYILERLCYAEVLTKEDMELTVQNVRYEPLWSFVDNQLGYLPPNYAVAKLVIDAVLAAIHQDGSFGAKYKDNSGSPEEMQKRVAGLQEELFGNETETGDALAHGEAVVVPRNYGVKEETERAQNRLDLNNLLNKKEKVH